MDSSQAPSNIHHQGTPTLAQASANRPFTLWESAGNRCAERQEKVVATPKRKWTGARNEAGLAKAPAKARPTWTRDRLLPGTNEALQQKRNRSLRGAIPATAQLTNNAHSTRSASLSGLARPCRQAGLGLARFAKTVDKRSRYQHPLSHGTDKWPRENGRIKLPARQASPGLTPAGSTLSTFHVKPRIPPKVEHALQRTHR